MSETEWGENPPRDLAERVAARDDQSTAALADLLRADQEQRWAHGQRIAAEDYLRWFPQMSERAEDVLLLIYCEILLRESLGERPGVEEYLARFPRYAEPIRRQFELHSALLAGQTTPPVEAATLPPGVESAGGAASGTSDGDLPGYEVLRELGRGGMGVVYQARQTGLVRIVALKMILAGAHTSADDLARFGREAEAVARLNHPNVVQVYHVGKRDGLPFFAMEFCAGGSLAEQLGGKPQAPRRAAEVIETLARAVQAAHEAGVVHRDLKPANVLIDSTGTLKITDFGLAKKLDGAVDLTQSGAIMGTPSYMAPEQASGDGKRVGPAADIYALGAILYEMLTGGPPFKGATPFDTVMQALCDTPVSPARLRPDLPPELEALCLHCLEKKPSQRPRSAGELADDLRRFLDGLPIASRPKAPPRPRRGLALVYSFLASSVISLPLLIAAIHYAQNLERASFGRPGVAWALSPGERWFAWASQDGKSVWLANTIPTEKPTTFSATATAFAFAPEGQLAVGTAEGFLEMWEPGGKRRFARVQLHRKPIRRIVFTDDGGILVGAGKEGLQVGECEEVKRWDRATHREGSSVDLRGFLSPDGRAVVGPGPAGSYRLVDAVTGKERSAWPRESSSLPPTFSPDSSAFAMAEPSGSIEIREITSGRPLRTLRAESGDIQKMLFSEDARLLALAGRSGVKVWEVATGRSRASLEMPGFTPAAFSPDGSALILQEIMTSPKEKNASGRLRLVELDAGHIEAEVSGHAFLALSSDGATLFTTLCDGRDNIHQGRVYAWDTVTFWRLTWRNWGLGGLVGLFVGSVVGLFFAHSRAVQNSVVALTFSPDGLLMASASGGTIQLWDVVAERHLFAIPAGKARVRALGFSEDGGALAALTADGRIQVWDVLSGKEQGSLQLSCRELATAAFGPGLRQVAGAEGGMIAHLALRCHDLRLWELSPCLMEATERTPLKAQDQITWGVTFSADGRTVAVMTATKGLMIWDLDPATGSSRERHQPDLGRAFALAPDGGLVAGGLRDEKTICVRDSRTEREQSICRVGGLVEPRTTSLAFSPDGQILAGTTVVSTVLWNVADGRKIAQLPVTGLLAFSPDGRVLAVGEVWLDVAAARRDYQKEQSKVQQMKQRLLLPEASPQTTLKADLQQTKPPKLEVTPTQLPVAERVPPASPGLVPGYEVVGELGRGGMGVVYKARQQELNRLVALKVILPGSHAGPDDRTRFRREAEAVARLRNPNVVKVYEVGEHQGLLFFSMELYESGNLAEKLAGRPLPPVEAAEMVSTLARAMQSAHEADVVHRDLKPSNVLLARKASFPGGSLGQGEKASSLSSRSRAGGI